MTSALTIEQIDRGLDQLADIMERSPYGEHYWLIFDRLEEERRKLESRADRLSAVRRRVNQIRQAPSAA